MLPVHRPESAISMTVRPPPAASKPSRAPSAYCNTTVAIMCLPHPSRVIVARLIATSAVTVSIMRCRARQSPSAPTPCGYLSRS